MAMEDQQKRAVFVVGSLNMDLVIKVDRWPNAGETLLGESIEYLPGGKGANQAAAAGEMGALTYMVGKVGSDSFGEMLCKSLNEHRVITDYVKREPDAPTGLAIIGVDKNGENRIVVISGANFRLMPEDLKSLDWSTASILLLQLEIPTDTVLAAAKLGAEHKAFVVLDPAPARDLPDELWQYIDLITPNTTEAQHYTGVEIVDMDSARKALQYLKRLAKAVALKMGEKGVLIADGDDEAYIEAEKVNAIDTTGAGDVFAGALAFMLSNGKSLYESAIFANHVAAISTTKKGAMTSIPSIREVVR
jgi:ribokinase